MFRNFGCFVLILKRLIPTCWFENYLCHSKSTSCLHIGLISVARRVKARIVFITVHYIRQIKRKTLKVNQVPNIRRALAYLTWTQCVRGPRELLLNFRRKNDHTHVLQAILIDNNIVIRCGHLLLLSNFYFTYIIIFQYT